MKDSKQGRPAPEGFSIFGDSLFGTDLNFLNQNYQQVHRIVSDTIATCIFQRWILWMGRIRLCTR